MSQIECKDVSVKYENQVVLEDISFSIEQGDYLCIVGENGSGKSTFTELLRPNVDYINADEIQKNLKCDNLTAAKIAEKQREEHLSGYYLPKTEEI